MSDLDDASLEDLARLRDLKTEAKATKFRKILDKLELIEKAVNKLNEDKPKQYNKPMDKGSDVYKNKRNVYVNKLNNLEIKEPKQQTLDYYGVKFDDVKREYV